MLSKTISRRKISPASAPPRATELLSLRDKAVAGKRHPTGLWPLAGLAQDIGSVQALPNPDELLTTHC